MVKKHCLFFTCKKAMEDCEHDEYTVVKEKISLREAKKKYPEVKFCKDWETD